MNILVAEDDRVSRMVLEKLLTQLGHTVAAFEDGGSAWEELQKNPYPVVITDWCMPGVDGLELVQRLRKIRSRDYSWVIMLTARDFDQNYAATIEAGVDDYLTKPLDRRLLETRLRVAQRVVQMSHQIRDLSACLPICMHCKSVRDEEQRWHAIEKYVSDRGNLDLSHGYCPDCFFQSYLLPDLQAAFPSGIERAAEPKSGIDADQLRLLAEVDSDDGIVLFDDLVESFMASADGELLQAALVGGKVHAERLETFQQRCRYLGAWRLEQMVEEAPLGRVSEQELAREMSQVCKALSGSNI